MIRIVFISSGQHASATQAEETSARVRAATGNPKVDFRNLPLRTAREQLDRGGLDSYAVVTDQLRGLVYVAGRDGGARMLEWEWSRYQQFVELANRLMPRPSYVDQLQSIIGMLDAFRSKVRKAHRSNFAQVFGEIEELLRLHAGCLNEEEREDMLRQVVARLKDLKEAVLRAEEIWREEGGQVSRKDGAPISVRAWVARNFKTEGGSL